MGKKINNHILNCLGVIMFQQRRQELLTGKIMTQVNELASELVNVKNQVVKGMDEVKAKVASLEAALENASLSAEAEAALAELKAASQALDDLNPDQAPAPAPEEVA